MKRISQGFLLVIEGIDGSGKTTLAQRLSEALAKSGYEVVVTREPGGTEFGKELRHLLQHGKKRPTPQAEFLLFAADRAQHIHEIVKPALQACKIVISDRMADSSLAYQGYGRGVDHAMITSVNAWALQGVMPDMVVYVTLDWQTALQRIEKSRAELTAFEQEKREFFERVAQGFDTIFKDRDNVVKVDGSSNPEDIFEQVYGSVARVLEQRI